MILSEKSGALLAPVHPPGRELKQLLSLHGLLYGVPVDEMPFMLHASVVAPYFTSTWGFTGGGKQLADAFEKRLQELGVDIRTGCGAERIELTPERLTRSRKA